MAEELKPISIGTCAAATNIQPSLSNGQKQQQGTDLDLRANEDTYILKAGANGNNGNGKKHLTIDAATTLTNYQTAQHAGQSERAMLELPRGVMIQHISAVTLAVDRMQPSIAFYEKLGFQVVYGGYDSAFTTLQSGEAFVNLVATPGHQPYWWGRVIFRIDDADVHNNRLVAAGLEPRSRRTHPGTSDSFTFATLTGTKSAWHSCRRARDCRAMQ